MRSCQIAGQNMITQRKAKEGSRRSTENNWNSNKARGKPRKCILLLNRAPHRILIDTAMDFLALPFTERILDSSSGSTTNASDVGFASRLPASTRTGRGKDHIAVPQPDLDFLERELSVQRINDVQDWLWICGRPMPPRPLHQQVLHSRTITICEEAALHLVWHKDRIFLKPVPLYLLDPDFWTAHLIACEKTDERQQKVIACALGFLFSYMALIAYQSDFEMAKESGLLPRDVEWYAWQTLTAQLLESHSYASINQRYWYGELRLSRLNAVYKFRKGAIFRGYSRVGSHTAYEDLIRDNLATLATGLGYVVIVLTAMQVGLSIDRLGSNQSFLDMSYGFAIFAIVAPLAAVAVVCLLVLVMFVSNWWETKRYEHSRFREMDVEKDWKKNLAARGSGQLLLPTHTRLD
ncbi:hypothetical protein N0V90_002079 [Kalmusia sp. IMI 367209]|nr:hypothetical protein N0V90_002079 [Kalmusia sp. IMI 367209]